MPYYVSTSSTKGSVIIKADNWSKAVELAEDYFRSEDTTTREWLAIQEVTSRRWESLPD